MAETPRTPREARTFKQICDLPRDGMSTRDYWISVDVGTVAIYKQRIGSEPTEKVTISRRAFDRFVDWYQTGRTRTPAKRSAAGKKPDKPRKSRSPR